MNVQELRIGNIVTHEDYSSDVFRVRAIELFNGDYVINTWGGKNETWINPVDLVNPVPLTEKWLKEFGFYTNEHPSGESYQLDTEHGVTFWGRPRHGISAVDDYNNEVGEPAKYVHQLQNLYFSLVGTELTCAPQS